MTTSPSDFDPGDGWTEISVDESYPSHVHRLHEYDQDNRVLRTWVREEPVSPLPTEPGYYVDADGCAWRLDSGGEWDDTFGNPASPGSVDPKLPLERYEPRRETAKAVLDRMQQLRGLKYGDRDIQSLRDEFEVNDA